MKPSDRIEQYLGTLGDWRGETLRHLRRLITAADPGLTETWKWNTPVWEKGGLVCAASAFKHKVKINFFKGASLPDPKGLFNAGLDAKTMRSIDLAEGESLDETALQDLVRAAVALNRP
jgi:hypothetical protein